MLNFELITPINGELTDAGDRQIQTCKVLRVLWRYKIAVLAFSICENTSVDQNLRKSREISNIQTVKGVKMQIIWSNINQWVTMYLLQDMIMPSNNSCVKAITIFRCWR